MTKGMALKDLRASQVSQDKQEEAFWAKSCLEKIFLVQEFYKSMWEEEMEEMVRMVEMDLKVRMVKMVKNNQSWKEIKAV